MLRGPIFKTKRQQKEYARKNSRLEAYERDLAKINKEKKTRGDSRQLFLVRKIARMS